MFSSSAALIFFVGMPLMLAFGETLLFFFHPAWLVPFTLPAWEVASRRYTLIIPVPVRRVEHRDVGYRVAPFEHIEPPERAALPALPERTEIGDDVLQADQARVTLRKGYRLFQRSQWLVHIRVAREGDDVLLSARLLVVPTLTLLTIPLLMFGTTRAPAGLLIGLAAVVFGAGIQLFFASLSCGEPVNQALAWIEDYHRKALGQ